MLPEHVKKMLDDLEKNKNKTDTDNKLMVELQNLDKNPNINFSPTKVSMAVGGVCPACGRSISSNGMRLSMEAGGNCPVCGR